MLVDATSFTLTINIFKDVPGDIISCKPHKSCIMGIREGRKRLPRNQNS